MVLSFIYVDSKERGLPQIKIKNNNIDAGFEKYFKTKVDEEKKHTVTESMLKKNIDKGEKVYTNYFNQNVFRLVDDILVDLQIENESKELPQDSEIKKMEGFEYIEFELLLLNCSFEKFGQFVNRLEKSDKIFIIDRFEFENGVDRGVQRALKNEGIFPGKDINMRIWAINLNDKSKSSNTTKKTDKCA